MALNAIWIHWLDMLNMLESQRYKIWIMMLEMAVERVNAVERVGA
jgi:hypothetical protein